MKIESIDVKLTRIEMSVLCKVLGGLTGKMKDDAGLTPEEKTASTEMFNDLPEFS